MIDQSRRFDVFFLPASRSHSFVSGRASCSRLLPLPQSAAQTAILSCMPRGGASPPPTSGTIARSHEENMKMYLAGISLGKKSSCTTVQRTSTENPRQNQPTADRAVNFARRTVNPVKRHVNLSFSQESTTTSGRIPTQPSTATSVTKSSYRIPQTLSLQPFLQRPSKPSSLDGPASIIHLIRRSATWSLHLP